MESVIDSAIRTIIWIFCQVAFNLMDTIYGIINDIISLNLNDFSFIWDIYIGIMALILIFITIRVIIFFIQSMYDEEILEKAEPMTIISRMFFISMITIALPLILQNLSAFSTDMTKNIGILITGNSEVNRPSEIFMTASYSDNYTGEKVIDYKKININKKVNGEYVSFQETYNLMIVCVMAICGSVLFGFIALQISQRWYSFLMKIGISPYSISGLIIEKNEEFNVWFKLIIGDLLTGFFQIILVTLLFVSIISIKLNPIAKSIFFLGGLMAVMNAPSGIAQLLGGDVGTGTALQQLQSTAMLGTALNTAGQVGIMGSKFVGGKLLSTGAGLTYGAGRLMGGKGQSNSFINGGMMNVGNSSNTPNTSVVNNSGKEYGANPLNDNFTPNSDDKPRITVDNNPYTREGTFARRMSDKFSDSGLGRLSKKGAEKVYKSSANRLFKERIGKDGVSRNPTANKIKRGVNNTNEIIRNIKDVYRGNNNGV